MRKFLTLLMVLMLGTLAANAQSRTITGQVVDQLGSPLDGASVLVKGTSNGTNTGSGGSFSITASTGDTLIITSVNFGEKHIAVESASFYRIELTPMSTTLGEVVVTTAFGVTRSQRITPYSSQVVGREQLSIIPQTNVNNALAGKVAGVQFRGQSPMKLNSQGYLRMRGGLSLSDVGALFVVDGTPITDGFDINPDDIESITVLKGANATALLGERARGGAVMITTRKKGSSQTSIEVNHGTTFDRVYILPKYQNLYAGGAAPDLIQFNYAEGMPQEWQSLDGKYYHEYTDDASWGPRMAGQEYIPWYAWTPGHSRSGQTAKLLPQPTNSRDFFSTGVTSVSNVSLTKSGQGYNSRVSYTNNTVKGMLPNTGLSRNTLFTALTLNLNDHLTFAGNVNYVQNRINGEFDDTYANPSTGNFNQWFHRDLDMGIMKELSGLRTPIGTAPSWNLAKNPSVSTVESAWRGNYWYNMYTYFNAVDYDLQRDRLYGDMSLTYALLNNTLKFKGTIRKNQLNTLYENIRPSLLEASAEQTGELASYATGQTRYNEMNYEFLTSYTKSFLDNKLNININGGGNVLKTNFKNATASTDQGLNIPDFYAVSNSVANPIIQNTRQQSEVRSLFAFGDIEFNRMFAANFALRNDWYSTLPAGNNSLLSPAAGGSFFFTDLTKNALPWLSYGKVFASWGKKPTSLAIYQNNFLYSVYQNQWNGQFLMSSPNTFIDPATTGALITTFEAGFDFRFMENKLGLNLTYYDEVQKDAPLTIPTSGISGFTSTLVNATRVERRGIEVILTATPVRTQRFNWDISKTFGYLIANPVVELLPGQNRLLLAGGSFGTRFARAFQEVGADWGQLIGGGIKRNADGLPVINEAMPGGLLYVNDPEKHWGSIIPKLTGGLVNTLTYKNVILNFNIDYQFGGKFFSLSEMWGNFSGLMEPTAAINDKGYNVRDDVSEGGGVHVVGVSSVDEKTPVDMYVPAQDYYHSFYYGQIAEPYVHSLSYVKLREVSLGYSFPIKSTVIKRLAATLVARNPLLIYRETRNFDPSEISAIQGEDGQLPGTRSLGFNIKLNF